MAHDGQILQVARTVAKDLLEIDPNLELVENKILNLQLIKLQKNVINWGVIS